MKKIIIICFVAFTLCTACKHEPIQPDPSPPLGGGTCSPDTAYFVNDILPIFQTNCAKSSCHDAASHQRNIILTDYDNIIRTGSILGGDPSHGPIYQSISTTTASLLMPPPPFAALSSESLNKIYKWIMQGALNNRCIDTVAIDSTVMIPCDTFNVKYSTKITDILNNHCVSCHNSSSAAGGVILSGYANAQAYALNGYLLGTITHDPAYLAMPPSPDSLSECEKNNVRIWVNDGAPHN